MYRHEPYTLTITLTISDDDRDGVWVVTEADGDTFGDGLTPYWAVADFLECKASLMKTLMQEAHNLGKGLHDDLQRLTTWAEGRRADD